MSENKQQQEGISVQKQAERPSDFSSELQKLVKFGGFNALESSIDGIASMNPERKARRKMFLTDPERAKERKELIKRLEMWLNMLKEGKSISEMIDICKEKSNLVADLLKKNQMKAIEEIKPLETSYRTVMLFYKNTESDKIKNIQEAQKSEEYETFKIYKTHNLQRI